jgi:hypothetical protein
MMVNKKLGRENVALKVMTTVIMFVLLLLVADLVAAES